MKKLINLTPHLVNDLDSNNCLEPAKSTKVLRIKKRSLEVETVMGAVINDYEEEVLGPIPDYNPARIYIVSKRVADAMIRIAKYAHRDDFIYPQQIEHENISMPIIDANGKNMIDNNGNIIMKKIQKIKGCHGFERAMSKIVNKKND